MSAGAPTLSVIIPTYNRAEFARACVQSLQHSGVSDIEILVVDDGSTDDTAAVIAAFNSKHVIYLQQKNAGPAAARNNGFHHSRGKYVAFLDSDDEWLPGVAPKMVELLETHRSVDVLFSDAKMGNAKVGYQSFVEIAGQAAFLELPHQSPEPGFRIFERTPFFRRMSVRNPVFIGALIMQREAFARAGMFDAELCGAADWELWMRMASQMTYGYWPGPLAIYTRHGDCMSNDHDVMGEDFCLALKKVLEKCVALDDDDRAYIEGRLRFHRFSQGYRAYDRGDYALARRRFGLLLTECGPEKRAAAYWLLCAMPLGLPGAMRKLKQTLFPA